MITIRKEIQSEIVFMEMNEMVPKESIFRKIDKYIDFTFIYEEVKELYCENNGRPSIDPVVLFKLVFIQALDGIKNILILLHMLFIANVSRLRVVASKNYPVRQCFSLTGGCE